MKQDARAALEKETRAWPADAQTLARLLTGRYSCRGYRPDPVPRPLIEGMLQLAQLSASWCNSQPWQVLITEGRGTERFRDALFALANADQGAARGTLRFRAGLPLSRLLHRHLQGTAARCGLAAL